MARIARSSSLKNSRFQLQYANQLSNAEFVRRVDPTDPIKKLRNHTEHTSDHQLNFYNNYYQSFEELKKEFKEFYHDERALREALDSIEDNRGHLEETMRSLIDKYNNALQSLKSIDEAVQTAHTLHVKEQLAKYHPILQLYGIHETSDGNIDLDTTVFEKKLMNSDGDEAALFTPLKEVIFSIYRVLYSIRIPKEKHKNQYNKPQIDMRGLYIESKL